jgi:hypothetical protein
LPARRSIVLSALLAMLIVGWLWRRDAASRRPPRQFPPPLIDKQPVTFAKRTFDPTAPPPDMPSLAFGEDAECDSDFQSNATVDGESRQIDSTHATVTVTQIKVTLQLHITIWVPAGVDPRVIEHENGHRQISEYYYQTADQLAARIAATYMGKQAEIAGADLNAESGKILRQFAAEITDEYNKELSPETTQQLYDSITDHSRNEVVADDAVGAAIRNIKIASIQPATNPAN